jgi:DnaD/phage-associated family protein
MTNKPFTGFSTDKQKTIRVPEGFFEDVAPQITSMLEMKVTLHLFWCLSRNGRAGGSGSPRMVSLAELEGDLGLRSALTPNRGPRPLDEALREGLELAVGRGTILQLWVREEPTDVSDGRAEQWFVLNTRDNRAWVEALGKGEVDVSQTPLITPVEEGPKSPPAYPTRIRVIAERPNIYALYEQNIGLLTPILAERLQDAEGRYPIQWIEDAFSEAVLNNKRNWRYIERILERWASEGKDSGKDREGAGRGLDPDKYTKGKYAFLFRPDR